jgi:hypothetical protein
MTDVVALYLNPPQQAIILCIDEKSQIQALDRTQPGLPIKKGRCGTMTHDYKRNGTTTLFAAPETLQGNVVGECHERHRHQEFLRFLRRLDAEFPGDEPRDRLPVSCRVALATGQPGRPGTGALQPVAVCAKNTVHRYFKPACRRMNALVLHLATRCRPTRLSVFRA